MIKERRRKRRERDTRTVKMGHVRLETKVTQHHAHVLKFEQILQYEIDVHVSL